MSKSLKNSILWKLCQHKLVIKIKNLKDVKIKEKNIWWAMTCLNKHTHTKNII